MKQCCDKMTVNRAKTHLEQKRISVIRQATPQVIAATVKNILLIGFGMTLGYPTILIPAFSGNADKNSFSLGPEAISWIGSINLICVPFGCVLSGGITQALGRKRTMQLNNIPFLCAWLLFSFSTEIWHVFLALIITGLDGGFLEAPVITYLAEISQPHLRGMLSSTSTMAVIFGILIQFIVGSFYHWRTVALINCSVPILSIICLFFIPESPHWLIMKNRLEDARKSLRWLRGWTTEENIELEFRELCQYLNKNPSGEGDLISNIEDRRTLQARIKRILKLFSRRDFTMPYLLVACTFFLCNFSGLATVQTYAVQIFATLKSPINKYYATIILGVAELIGCIGCVILIHYTGKRLISIFSLVSSGLCCFIVATYAYMIDVKYLETSSTSNINSTIENQATTENNTSYNWLPVTVLIALAFLSHLGIRVLPWILTGEVFANDTRAAGSGFSSGISYIFGFLTNKVFLSMISSLTFPGTFWLYTAISVLGSIYLYFYLPETEGKTLQEITDHFSGKLKIDNNVRRHRKARFVKEEVNHAYSNTEDIKIESVNIESRL